MNPLKYAQQRLQELNRIQFRRNSERHLSNHQSLSVPKLIQKEPFPIQKDSFLIQNKSFDSGLLTAERTQQSFQETIKRNQRNHDDMRKSAGDYIRRKTSNLLGQKGTPRR